MAERVKTRRYESPRRREQAAATRAQMLASAQRLFERDGYAATSMAAVAADAGVSLKTVYVVFETKSGLLRTVWHRVLRGDGDGVPVGDQPWFRRVLDEPEPVRLPLPVPREDAVASRPDVAVFESADWRLT
jgi:AcrR family transcriptional regulator